MAHPEQRIFFEQLMRLFPETFGTANRILEVGSQDINGSIRDFFKQATNYIGLDIGMAKGVDWTIPGELVELPDKWADISISTECFEHTASWPEILINMIRITKEDGLIILTMAGDGRGTHGTIDSDEGSSPFTTSYYKNIGVDEMTEKIKFGFYFKSHGFTVNSKSKDTYFWGTRSGNSVVPEDGGWESPMSRLARAQGQLSHAVHRQNELLQEIHHTQEQVVKAKEEYQALKKEYQALKKEYQNLAGEFHDLAQEHTKIDNTIQSLQETHRQQGARHWLQKCKEAIKRLSIGS
jgi:hypothetical protein